MPLKVTVQTSSPWINTSVTYLQKKFKDGILLIGFYISGMFVCVNVYAKRSHKMLDKPMKNLFIDELSKFKNITHLNSAVFDFHLRHIAANISKKHFPIDYLDVLESFVKYNSRSGRRFSRNRLFEGSLNCEFDISIIFKYEVSLFCLKQETIKVIRILFDILSK